MRNLLGRMQRKTEVVEDKSATETLADPPLLPIARQIDGIKSIDLVHSRLDGDVLQLQEDSQIHFMIDQNVSVSELLIRIDLSIEMSDTDVTPKIYLDYGLGYAEETGFMLHEVAHERPNLWIGYIPIPHMLKRARLDITEEVGCVRIDALAATKADLASVIDPLKLVGAQHISRLVAYKADSGVLYLNKNYNPAAPDDHLRNNALLASSICHAFHRYVPGSAFRDKKYLSWIAANEILDETDIDWMKERSDGWKKRPLLSVIMPVYDPPLDLLNDAIASLQAQVYDNWELCIADDASQDQRVRSILDDWSKQDHRVKVTYRSINGHISKASNSAAELAIGDFLVLMDNDDLLPPHALWTIAQAIDDNPDCAMLFSDEDKIDVDGVRCEPYRKGGFDRFLMYGHNMFSHLGVFKKSLFDAVGGFREGLEGSQDYDLTLRCMEICGEDRIVHVPHVLYHWRQIPGSTSMGAGHKSYAFDAAKRALNEHFQRCAYPCESVDSDVPGVSAIRVLSTADPATVSVVIPTRDNLDVLRPCIESLQRYADPLMEVVIVDNGSEREETFAYYERLEREPRRYRIVRSDEPFNFSRLCNAGVAQASGEIVCLLNNDTEVIVPGIFERARAWLSVPDIGVVGARLLYPDGSLQHFGVYTGVGAHGIAEHSYLGLPDEVHTNFSKNRLMQQFNAVTAACLFMRKSDYVRVGGMAEDFPVAYNDVDLCLRVRRHGLKVVCDPAIRLIHKESKSRGRDVTDKRKARLQQDAKRMVEKWGEDGLLDPFYNPSFSKGHATFEVDLKTGMRPPWKSPGPVAATPVRSHVMPDG